MTYNFRDKFLSLILFIIPLTIPLNALACPTCGGTGDPKKDNIVVALIGGFILCTYLIYVIIFRLIYKYKDYHHESSSNHIQRNNT